jgi:hypothetical protein
VKSIAYGGFLFKQCVAFFFAKALARSAAFFTFDVDGRAKLFQ